MHAFFISIFGGTANHTTQIRCPNKKCNQIRDAYLTAIILLETLKAEMVRS